MNEVISYINNNSGFFTFVITLFLVVITAIYVVLTYGIMKETRKSTDALTQPEVIVYIKHEIGLIRYLVIKNIGNGVAKNLTFSISQGLYDIFPVLKDLRLLQKGFKILAPGESLQRLLYVKEGSDISQEDIIHTIKCKYFNKLNIKKEWETEIDLKDYFHLNPQQDKLGEINDQLKKIADNTKNLGTMADKLDLYDLKMYIQNANKKNKKDDL